MTSWKCFKPKISYHVARGGLLVLSHCLSSSWNINGFKWFACYEVHIFLKSLFFSRVKLFQTMNSQICYATGKTSSSMLADYAKFWVTTGNWFEKEERIASLHGYWTKLNCPYSRILMIHG